MSAIIDTIRRVVRQELAALRLGQLAEVTKVAAHTDEDDEHNYAATVRLKHEDIELRAVPLAQAAQRLDVAGTAGTDHSPS